MSPDDQADRELTELEERSERVGAEISEARSELIDDHKPEGSLEGAIGDHPEDAGPEPEADYPAKD